MRIITINEVKQILNEGGASINYRGRNTALRSGYMVSDYGNETQVPADDIKRVQATIEKKFNDYGGIGSYIGVWVEDGTVYIDVSHRYATKKEAIQIGIQNQQLAIYANERQVVIHL